MTVFGLLLAVHLVALVIALVRQRRAREVFVDEVEEDTRPTVPAPAPAPMFGAVRLVAQSLSTTLVPPPPPPVRLPVATEAFGAPTSTHAVVCNVRGVTCEVAWHCRTHGCATVGAS